MSHIKEHLLHLLGVSRNFSSLDYLCISVRFQLSWHHTHHNQPVVTTILNLYYRYITEPHTHHTHHTTRHHTYQNQHHSIDTSRHHIAPHTPKITAHHTPHPSRHHTYHNQPAGTTHQITLHSARLQCQYFWYHIHNIQYSGTIYVYACIHNIHMIQYSDSTHQCTAHLQCPSYILNTIHTNQSLIIRRI